MRVGVLGASRIAPTAVIGPAARRDDVTVVAVAARDPDRAVAYADEHGIGRAESDYRSLVEADDVDLVYVGLPPSGHAEWSIAAVEAGRDVLCEKPFARNADEASAMVAAAERTGRLLVEAFHWRYHPLAARIAELVPTLGPLRRAEATFAVGRMAPTDFRRVLHLGGGALMDLGCYAVHWCRTFVPGEPEVVSAQVEQDPDAPGVDLELVGRLRFPDGVEATVTAAMLRAGVEARLTLEGEVGRLEVDNPLAPHRGHELRVEAEHGRHTEVVAGETTFDHQLAAAVGAVRDRSWLPTGGADAVANMVVIDALYRAAGLHPRGMEP